jgi:glutamate synthase (NADPH/NADH) large chain
MLGNELTKRYGAEGLPDGTIDIRLKGSAGQSFGAFVPRGIKLTLSGDSNDYVGKGLSGGTIVIRPDERSIFAAEENIIAGNVLGYGATSGTMLLRGIVGERFLVRNSGVTAVVEGVGDHALEYMTGGCAVILGSTGRNLGAGMSGGVAYVYKLRADHINAEALKAGELHIGDLEPVDETRLKSLLELHAAETGSAVAERMLANFAIEVKNFVRVLPSDYAAVLDIRSKAQASGIDPDHESVWKQILEVTNG